VYTLELAALSINGIRQTRERGEPAFPTSRLLNLRDCFTVESLSSEDHNVNFDQPRGQEGGLAPRSFARKP
jgi:hypothetical protein